MSDNGAPPGMTWLAVRIERRRFLRNAANALFYGMVAVASGTTGLLTFLTDPARAAGACCPPCCGPSPCCGTSCCNKNCCGTTNPCNCRDNADCNGPDYRHYPRPNNCWSCGGTTCCDCHTASEQGCPNPYATRRCICYC